MAKQLTVSNLQKFGKDIFIDCRYRILDGGVGINWEKGEVPP
jgi:hypothetical protein